MNRAAAPLPSARCSLSLVFLSALYPLSRVSALASLPMLHAFCITVPPIFLVMLYRYTVLPTNTARRAAVRMR